MGVDTRPNSPGQERFVAEVQGAEKKRREAYDTSHSRSGSRWPRQRGPRPTSRSRKPRPRRGVRLREGSGEVSIDPRGSDESLRCLGLDPKSLYDHEGRRIDWFSAVARAGQAGWRRDRSARGSAARTLIRSVRSGFFRSPGVSRFIPGTGRARATEMLPTPSPFLSVPVLACPRERRSPTRRQPHGALLTSLRRNAFDESSDIYRFWSAAVFETARFSRSRTSPSESL